VQQLITLRQSLSIYARPRQISLVDLLHQSRIEYHGTHLYAPDWGHDSRTLAFAVWGNRSVFYLIVNAYWEPLAFALPPMNGTETETWRRIIDTACAPPADFCPLVSAPFVPGSSYIMQSRSVVLLAAARNAG
jgi:glycogen operon protein